MPASKPVADPARSTDPRDYQRVGRPLGVMAKTFPAGFVVAEHRHERAQLIHALSGVIELHVGRTLWLVPPSSRTLARLFLSELGVTFVHWRHQVRLAAALPRLAAGEAVARIAVDLGYQTPSAFSAMFRRLTGSTPSRYFALSDSA